MIIKKTVLKQIIREELMRLTENEDLKRNVIQAFIKFIGSKDTNSFVEETNNLGIEPTDAINMFSSEEVEPTFYGNACEMHNQLVRDLGKGEEKPINAFAHFPKIGNDPTKEPNSNFMRSPKKINTY